MLAFIISILLLAMVVGGILLLKQSAKKFDLTDEQLKKINARNKQIEKQEKDED
jgi:hypothetical protein